MTFSIMLTLIMEPIYMFATEHSGENVSTIEQFTLIELKHLSEAYSIREYALMSQGKILMNIQAYGCTLCRYHIR